MILPSSTLQTCNPIQIGIGPASQKAETVGLFQIPALPTSFSVRKWPRPKGFLYLKSTFYDIKQGHFPKNQAFLILDLCTEMSFFFFLLRRQNALFLPHSACCKRNPLTCRICIRIPAAAIPAPNKSVMPPCIIRSTADRKNSTRHGVLILPPAHPDNAAENNTMPM